MDVLHPTLKTSTPALVSQRADASRPSWPNLSLSFQTSLKVVSECSLCREIFKFVPFGTLKTLLHKFLPVVKTHEGDTSTCDFVTHVPPNSRTSGTLGYERTNDALVEEDICCECSVPSACLEDALTTHRLTD